MHIAFDASGMTCPSNSRRGIGRYAKQHLQALLNHCPEARITLLYEDGVSTNELEEFQQTRIVSYGNFRFDSADVLHLPDPMTLITGRPTLLPRAADCRTTILFHDLIPLIIHDEHIDHFSTETARQYLGRLKIVREHVDFTFTNSENTRQDIIRVARISDDKSMSVYAGSHLAEIPPSSGWREKFGDYFLAVGGLDSHKGFHRTFSAFLELHRTGVQAQLVIVGSPNDPYKVAYQKVAEESGVGNRVIFTGFVSDTDLAGIYREALALVYPSRYEGFGFPVLEAMSQGCPVITCKNSSLAEVGEQAVLYIDDNNLPDLMNKIYRDNWLRIALSEKGKARAKGFSWEYVAKATCAVWQKLLSHDK